MLVCRGLFNRALSRVSPVSSFIGGTVAGRVGRCMHHGGCGCKQFSTANVNGDESNSLPESVKAMLNERDTDMENLRARTKREVEQGQAFAIQKFAKDVCGVADVLEMALKSVDPKHPLLTTPQAERAGPQSDEDAQSTPVISKSDAALADLVQGLSMTLEELHRVFRQHGITIIDPLHQRFDPNQHNALFELDPPAGVEPGTVLSVQKKGYLLHQRVLRAADVGVARAGKK